MARINNTINQQNVKNPDMQSVRWPAAWVQAPSVTPKSPDTMQNWENFNEAWGANSKLWDAFNKYSDFQWKVAWHLLVDPITWFKETKEKTDAASQYLNQNKQEQTVWWFNYSLNSNPSVGEQGQYNSLVGSGAVAWIPQNTSKLIEQPQTVEGTWKRVGTPLRVQIANEANAMEGETPAEPTAETPVQSPAVSTGSNWGYVWGGTTTNADVNFSQYWDDSSAPNQATAWGQNDKYTWEFTKNSNIWYDPNITTADLDPNYLFWMDAQWANTDSAGYIARRNDMIASALYNEWRTSKQDVIDFLSSQPGWMNSTEADRANTIESIWKRLGGMANENEIKDAAVSDLNKSTWVSSDPSVNAMEADLNKDNSWVIYWKVGTDKDGSVKTLEDENSVYRTMNEARIQQFKQLQSMDSASLAAAIVSNSISSDWQAMRDLQEYNPAKYEEVQQQIRQLKWQMTINSITNGDTYPTFNNGNAITNDISDFAITNSNSSTSSADILRSVNSSLSSNDAASTASETMASIESDMAVLQNRLKNLKKEAQTVFKWDVPQYIVNAYMANRTAEIQDQMSILENRYNAAQSRYQQEWERTKWAAEFDLKKQELQLKKENADLDNWSTRQWIALKWAELNGTTNWVTPLSTLSVQESMNILSDFSSSYANNSYGGQCGTFVKRYLSQLWVNLPNVSSLSSKMSLIDDSITEPNQWDVVIMNSTKYPENWHMAIVESIDDDGTIHLLESNWDNDELVHRRTIKPSDSKILGYYRPTGWNASSGNYEWKNVSNWVFTRNDGLEFDVASSVLFNSLSDTDKKTVIWLLNLQTDPNSLTTRMWYDKWQAQKLINAAQDINPAWKQDDFSNGQKVRQRWEKGKQWGWISRNWTAMKAAKELYEMADEIDKFPSMTLNWLKNAAAEEFWDPKIVKFKTTLEWFVTEAAGALKWWNAANATQDVARMDEILNNKMTKEQIKTSIRQLVDLLYGKNESEAMSVWEATFIKPNTPWIKDVADWMYDELWIRGQEVYYNYTPNGWWSVVWQANSNLSNDDMIYNIFSY